MERVAINPSPGVPPSPMTQTLHMFPTTAGEALTDDYLEPEFGVMFFGGFETTGHTAAWVLYLVSQVGRMKQASCT